MDYTNTLIGLDQRVQFHERQLRLIKTAQIALESDQSLVFEICRKTDSPVSKAITVEGPDLHETLKKYRELNCAWNGYEGGRAELFVRIGDIRIAIDPFDAGKENFQLDVRIAAYPKQMVFELGEKRPGAQYAESLAPTPKSLAVSA